MANHIENPRKKFNFSIEFVGMPFPEANWLCQKVQLPKTSIDQVKHGDANYDVNTGGRVKIGTMKITKLMTTAGPDNYFWNWLLSVQNQYVGGGLPPDATKKTILVKELAEDGKTVINKHLVEGVWPMDIDSLDLDRLSSDNSLEELELSVDKCVKL